MGPSLALFRADASTRIGGGHVHRCLAIAEAFKERGWTCAFATISDSLSAVPALASAVAEVLTLRGQPSDEAAVMQARWPAGPDLLLIDHYERDIAYERSLQRWGRVLAVLDDLDVQPHAADLVIDPAPGRAASAGGHLLSGPAYAPLRPEWAQWRTQSLSRDRSRPVERIVVSLGAIDAENVTAEVMRIAARMTLPCEFVVVLGPGAPHRDAIERLARTDGRFRVVVGPPEFARLMTGCDIAVGAAGSTSWERCCLGIPSVAIIIANNQRRNASGLDAAGAALIAGETAGRWQDGLSAALATLMSDPHRRIAMSKAAAALCDGRGAARIADAVIERLQAA